MTATRRRLFCGLALAALAAPAIASPGRPGPAPATAPARDEAPLLNPVFADHMVLQRGRPIAFWGEAAAGSAVTIRFAGEEKQARAGSDGTWRAEFAAREAATGLTLDVSDAAGRTLHAADVAVGDVFLCSGQSNMVVPVNRALNPQREYASRLDRDIRILRVDQVAAAGPQTRIVSRMSWFAPTPNTVKDFSAVCMFFGRDAAAAKKVPIGLVHAAWGGSQIEAWIPAGALRPFARLGSSLDLLAAYSRAPAAGYALAGKGWESWWRGSVSATDLPWTKTPEQIGALPATPATPGDWKDFDDPALKRHVGMVWYFRTLDLAPDQAAKARELRLGEVAEIGSVWINGKFLGSSPGGEPSIYTVPAGMLKAGTNTIAVSAYDSNSNIPAGLLGPAGAMTLAVEGGAAVPLATGWHYSRVENRRAEPPRVPWEGRLGVSGIYNAMIAPLGPLPLAGVLWYQGETNAEHPDDYKPLLRTMLASWRTQFRADLPFVLVQIANFGPLSATPDEDGSARIREIQREIAEEDPNVALAVTIDVGEKFDIHPPNKEIVAERAFQAARTVFYGEKVAPSGPRATGAKLEGGRVAVSFADYSGALMAASANRPFSFMVCPATGECRFTDAMLAGNAVLVDVPAGMTAARVRYCWGRSPICNLFDTAGKPVGPFEFEVRK